MKGWGLWSVASLEGCDLSAPGTASESELQKTAVWQVEGLPGDDNWAHWGQALASHFALPHDLKKFTGGQLLSWHGRRESTLQCRCSRLFRICQWRCTVAHTCHLLEHMLRQTAVLLPWSAAAQSS